MRVALLLTVWDDPVFQGLTRDLAACFRSQGAELFVVARRRSAGEPALSFEDGVLVRRVGWAAPAAPALEALVNALLVPWQTWRLLRAEPHDVLHYHFSGIDWNLLSLLTPWLRRPLVLTFHGCLGRGRHPVWERLTRRLVESADRVSAVSRSLLEEVLKGFPAAAGKESVVRNGVEVSFFQGSDAEAPAGRPYVLCVARLAPYKGHDLLLFAFLDVVRLGHDVDLVLCGPEEDDGHVRRLIALLGLSGRVRLTGGVPRSEVARLLRACRFVALASREGEAFPLSNLEALSAGKAVVAPDSHGIPEALTHEVNALLFPARDIDALRAAMLRLLEEPALRARLEAGAARSAGAFGREAMGEGYLSLYRVLLEGRT